MKNRKFWINMIIMAAIFITTAFPTTIGLAASTSLPGKASSQFKSNQLTRINFISGGTSAVVSGDLLANSTAQYVLRALANQVMDVSLTAPEGAKLSVTTSTGRALSAIASSTTSFRGYLPRNGDYVIKVTSGSKAGSYSVSVLIPERVSFERGATSATLKGTLKAHQSHDYVLGAMTGQLLEVNVTPTSGLQLIIYGIDGTVLRSGMGEGSSFRGQLPLTEDYIVTVRAGDQDVSYAMDVIIPVRISFASGVYSATVYGSVKADNSQFYVLKAAVNQTMQVKVTSARAIQLIVYGANGASVANTTNENNSFKGDLPTTQDYIVVVKAGASAASYTISFTIK